MPPTQTVMTAQDDARMQIGDIFYAEPAAIDASNTIYNGPVTINKIFIIVDSEDIEALLRTLSIKAPDLRHFSGRKESGATPRYHGGGQWCYAALLCESEEETSPIVEEEVIRYADCRLCIVWTGSSSYSPGSRARTLEERCSWGRRMRSRSVETGLTIGDFVRCSRSCKMRGPGRVEMERMCVVCVGELNRNGVLNHTPPRTVPVFAFLIYSSRMPR